MFRLFFIPVWLLCLGYATSSCVALANSPRVDGLQSLLQQHCVACHAGQEPAGGLVLPAWDAQNVAAERGVWERVVRRLQNGDMPPASAERPSAELVRNSTDWLVQQLDAVALQQPFSGPTESLRRLTRIEYRNAVRDLLAIDVDVVSLLPADESSQGFDNITVTGLSPTLLNRYIAAAEKISRLALGRPELSPGGETFRVPGDLTQDRMRPVGAPPGARGGIAVDWHFPRTGTYQVQVRLMRDAQRQVIRAQSRRGQRLDHGRVEGAGGSAPERVAIGQQHVGVAGEPVHAHDHEVVLDGHVIEAVARRPHERGECEQSEQERERDKATHEHALT